MITIHPPHTHLLQEHDDLGNEKVAFVLQQHQSLGRSNEDLGVAERDIVAQTASEAQQSAGYPFSESFQHGF